MTTKAALRRVYKAMRLVNLTARLQGRKAPFKDVEFLALAWRTFNTHDLTEFCKIVKPFLPELTPDTIRRLVDRVQEERFKGADNAND